MADYAAKFDALKKRHSARDERMRKVSLVRAGEAGQVFEGFLPEGIWSKPIIANMIDVVAKDAAEQMGVMPTITASGDSQLNESSRSNADKRTKCAAYYVSSSGLPTKQLIAADRFGTYGFAIYRVEPNFKEKRPHIHVDSSIGAYWDMSRFGKVTAYAHTYSRSAGTLAAWFPEHADVILRGNTGWGVADGSQRLEVVRWYDKDNTVLFLPARKGLILSSAKNKLGKVPVSIAIMPTFDDEVRGDYDDVLPVYAAKARLAALLMRGVQDSIEAPLATPPDVPRIPMGSNAIIRTNSPEKIRRIPVDVPSYAFAENNMLSDELKFGTRFPESRAGQADGSVVTGQGVKALNAGYDQRIKTGQGILGEALGDAVSIAFEVDEVYFGDVTKDVSGKVNGMPYKLKYTPSKDIKGQYSVSVEYGLFAGMDPNRTLVYLLQARGDKLVSRSMARRHLPVAFNASEEERAIDMEEMRDSLKAGFNSMAGAIPQMALQGQDPTDIVRKMAKAIEARRSGKSMEDAIALGFEPEKKKAQPAAPGTSPDAGMQDEASMMGLDTPGPGEPVQNQAVQQGPPPMQQLLAGLSRNGRPDLSSRVVRQVPA